MKPSPRIWITRSEPGATRLAQVLHAAGYRTLTAPVLGIEPLALSAPLPQRIDVAIALSEHAVNHAATELWRRAQQVVAVGAQTARALAQRGYPAALPEVASSEGLLAGPLKGLVEEGSVVALVAGAGGRRVLQEALQQVGATVYEALVYRRVALTEPPSGLGSVDAIVVSSGDGFKAAGRLWFATSARRDVPVFAPSKRVAEQALAIGFDAAINCGGADPESVLATLVRAGLGSAAGSAEAGSREPTRKQ